MFWITDLLTPIIVPLQFRRSRTYEYVSAGFPLQVNRTLDQRSKCQWATGQLLCTSTKTGWCMESNTNEYALQVNRSERQPSLDYVSIWKHFALQVNQTRWSKEHIPLENDLQFNHFFVVFVGAFTILSSLCSTGQQLFIIICSAVQPTLISLLKMLANVVFVTYKSCL